MKQSKDDVSGIPGFIDEEAIDPSLTPTQNAEDEIEEFAERVPEKATDEPLAEADEGRALGKYHRPLFVSGGQGRGYKILDIATYVVVAGLVAGLIWGAKALGAGIGKGWEVARSALVSLERGSSDSSCPTIEPVIENMGDLALVSFPRLFLYGEIPEPVVSVLKTATPKRIEGMQALAFSATDGEAVVVRMVGHPGDVGALYLNLNRKLDLCSALAKVGIRVGGGMYTVNKNGLVQGALPTGLEVLVSSRNGEVSAMRVRAVR